MRYIDIKDLKELKKDLETLDTEEVGFINDGDKTKYAILNIALYDRLESYRFIQEGAQASPMIKVISSDLENAQELTYEEYESIRKQLIDVFDKNFKPKPSKLN